MKVYKYLINNYINPAIPLIITTLVSKVYTGKWLEWINLISLSTLTLIVFVFFLWIVVIFIYRRVIHLKYLDGSFAATSFGAPYGWISLGDVLHKTVIWKVRAPKINLSGNYSISRIDVKTPPRCPNCKTELEESHSFFGGYIWKCIMCDFKKRNRDSFYKEKKRAEKIARRFLELENEKM